MKRANVSARFMACVCHTPMASASLRACSEWTAVDPLISQLTTSLDVLERWTCVEPWSVAIRPAKAKRLDVGSCLEEKQDQERALLLHDKFQDVISEQRRRVSCAIFAVMIHPMFFHCCPHNKSPHEFMEQIRPDWAEYITKRD